MSALTDAELLVDRLRVACLIVAAAVTATAVSAAPASTVTPQSRLGRCIADQAANLNFSGAVSVRSPGGDANYARGFLNGPESQEIGPDTRFNLASASKMFTAVAVAQLIDAGQISLNDNVGLYVHGLTPRASAVTVRQLLTHSSGLGNYLTPENMAAIQKAKSVSDLIGLVGSDEPAFAPGSQFQYSNTGFLLLGRMIETVAGLSYGDYLERHIFAAAGMKSSGLDPEPAASRAVGITTMPDFSKGPPAGPQGSGGKPILLVPGQTPPQGPARPALEAALRGMPAGGAYSTASDMQRFFAAFLAAKLTSAAMVNELTSAQIVVRPAKDGAPELDQGLGFGLSSFEGHRWFGHNGGAPGVNTEAAVFPDDGLSIVVLSNRDPPSATMLFRKVREFLFHPESCK